MSDTTLKSRKNRTRSAPERGRLFDIASEHGGYFTTDEAKAIGFSRALLSHHVKSGRFVRVKRGLYRFREYPGSPREHVLAAWLAVGKDTAVVSHESALDILGLSDIVPEAVHITVPRSRRSQRLLPGVKMHTISRLLPREDLVLRDGMVITSAARSIVDAAKTGAAPDQIEKAVIQAMERGLVTADHLGKLAYERGQRVAALITRALEKAVR